MLRNYLNDYKSHDLLREEEAGNGRFDKCIIDHKN